MGIKIDVRDLTEILRITPANQNIMIVGKHGIGKSRIVEAFYTAKKERVVTFFLGQMSDPGDLIGLMFKDEKTGRSLFMPPYWWPKEGESIVLFLDELNRARPEILQSVMDLTLNRTLAGKKLPEGSRIISAVNEGEEYQLTDLDPALVSRFNIYEFAPTVQDWMLWADAANLDKRVIQFIQKNPHFLDGDDKKNAYTDGFQQSLSKTPDRRAWERVATIVKPYAEISAILLKIIGGIVGMQAATHFKKSLGEFLKVTPEQLLLDFEKYKPQLKKFTVTELVFLNEQIALWINGSHYKTEDKPLILTHLEMYFAYLKKEKQNEAIAHFASLLENPKFGKLSGWVLIASPKIMGVLAEFIKNIQV